jgi:lambda repressor-like predicted transcriptional regulator
MVNTDKLNKKIKESGKTKTHLAKKAGISLTTLRSKINNIYPFNSDEMEVLCGELDIKALSEKESIFFAK